MAGAASGGRAGARTWRVAADRRRAGETGDQGNAGRRHRGHARHFIGDRQHGSDASLPASPHRRRSGKIRSAPLPMGFVLPWLVIAFATVALPWALYSRSTGASLHDALAPKELWAAFWPVLVGGLLSRGHCGAGDSCCRACRRVTCSCLAAVQQRWPAMPSVAMERLDRRLSQWPVAGVLFLVLTAVLSERCLSAIDPANIKSGSSSLALIAQTVRVRRRVVTK